MQLIAKQIFKKFRDLLNLNWKELSSVEELDKLIDSPNAVFALFKHSTRCAISAVAKKRLELSWEKQNPEIPIYYIDLIQNRTLSNYIAEKFNVMHGSPQLILLRNGQSIYHASHLSINPKSIATYK